MQIPLCLSPKACDRTLLRPRNSVTAKKPAFLQAILQLLLLLLCERLAKQSHLETNRRHCELLKFPTKSWAVESCTFREWFKSCVVQPFECANMSCSRQALDKPSLFPVRVLLACGFCSQCTTLQVGATARAWQDGRCASRETQSDLSEPQPKRRVCEMGTYSDSVTLCLALSSSGLGLPFRLKRALLELFVALWVGVFSHVFVKVVVRFGQVCTCIV